MQGFCVIGIVIAVGYVAARMRIGGPSAQMVLNRFSFFVSSPCLMFAILSKEPIFDIFHPSIIVAFFSAVLVGVVFLVLNRMFFHLNAPDATIGALNSLYLNSNNIGLPIATYILGNPALVAPILVMQQAIFTPVGLTVLDVTTKGKVSIKEIAKQPLHQPLLIGSLLGIVVSAISAKSGWFPVPKFIFDPIDMIGDSAVPMILMAFGMSLHGTKPLQQKGDRPAIFTVAVLKNIIMPIIAFLLAYFVMGFRGSELYACVVLAALPTGQNVYNYAARYNVGLTFDYPVSFGKSDSTAVYPEKYSVDEGETPDARLTDLWAYAVKNAEGEKTGMLTEYRFKTAHNFTLNRGAVIENNSERDSMSFVDENGRKAFDNTRVYVNQYDRYVKDFLLPPMTNGIESIGFYYFDSGLTRVRLQTVDYYNYAVRGVVRVVEDRDILIHPDGSEYDLPAGYTMTGYSEGAVVLKRDSDGMYGVLSVEGEWIAQPIYKSATPFIGGLATLGTDDGRYGMIDKSGNIVLPFTYDYVSQNSSGVVSAFRNENGWSVFKVMRKTKILG